MTLLPFPEPNFDKHPDSESRPRRIPADEAGSGIALALGGGFSRGFAHLGVLEVLEREQIPISAIVGTSIGALLGAAYADGISLRDLCDLGRRVRLRDFLRFYPSDPERSSDNKDCIGQFVQGWFRAGRLEQLLIPMAIVATDLETGAPYVFSSGPLEPAIRASCAFPGLTKPVRHDGRLLGDGCIVSPVPTEVAARIYGGCVLGVSVSPNSARSTKPEKMLTVLDPGFRPSRRGESNPSWSRHADVLLEPEVHQIDWNDFSRVDEAFSAGADAMRQALPSVRELLARRSKLQPSAGLSLPGEREVAL